MADFESPTDLMHNRGLISDPDAFARERGAASWLYLNGEEFASMEGGMSYADVERAVPVSANVVSDPPTPLDLDLARRQIESVPTAAPSASSVASSAPASASSARSARHRSSISRGAFCRSRDVSRYTEAYGPGQL